MRYSDEQLEALLADIESDRTYAVTPVEDVECLATLKHYRSLIPMGQETRKPIFKLTPADGAIGSHAQAVVAAQNDFKQLAEKLLERMKKRNPL